MEQQEFIWMAKNLKVVDVIQDEIGNTIIQLRPQVQLVHNYKKSNLMTVKFVEDQMMFIVPSRKELEEIYRLHLENENLIQLLREYCELHLKTS